MMGLFRLAVQGGTTREWQGRRMKRIGWGGDGENVVI